MNERIDLDTLWRLIDNGHSDQATAMALLAIAAELRRMNDRAEIQPEPSTQIKDQAWVDKHLGWPE